MTDDAAPPREDADDAVEAVQFCPFCGEPVGSFWGRRADDGDLWCEQCQTFFRVTRTG